MMMTDAKTKLFLDTNILIRLHVTTAPEHHFIKQVISRLMLRNYELWISRQVIREYANVLTRPQTYAPPREAKQVAQQLRLFEVDYRIAAETIGTSSYLYYLMDNFAMGGKQIHDANIVATMLEYQVPVLLTLNTVDFERFKGLIQILSPSDVPV